MHQIFGVPRSIKELKALARKHLVSHGLDECMSDVSSLQEFCNGLAQKRQLWDQEDVLEFFGIKETELVAIFLAETADEEVKSPSKSKIPRNYSVNSEMVLSSG